MIAGYFSAAVFTLNLKVKNLKNRTFKSESFGGNFARALRWTAVSVLMKTTGDESGWVTDKLGMRKARPGPFSPELLFFKGKLLPGSLISESFIYFLLTGLCFIRSKLHTLLPMCS